MNGHFFFLFACLFVTIIIVVYGLIFISRNETENLYLPVLVHVLLLLLIIIPVWIRKEIKKWYHMVQQKMMINFDVLYFH